MDKRVMQNDEWQKYLQSLNDKYDEIIKESKLKHNDSLSLIMIVTILTSFIVAVFIVGILISRYYKQNKRQNDHCISRPVINYIRQQKPSISCENLLLSPTKINQQSSEVINETMHTIKSSFSWPRENESNRENVESSLSSISSSSTLEHMIQPASLTFGIRWNEIEQTLYVRIVSIRDLFIYKNKKKPSVIDSYVRIELLYWPQGKAEKEIFASMRTHITKRNSCPVYDELFKFTNIKDIKTLNYSLHFTILTYDTFTRDDILGEITYPIEFETFDNNEITLTKCLSEHSRQYDDQQLGQMLLSLYYQPIDCSLTVTVLKAIGLPRFGSLRLPNPYFKIYMFYNNQRIHKKRSTIKRTTQNPVYNECFTFKIPKNDTNNIYFDIVTYDYDSHMKHKPIGKITLGKNIHQHWKDVFYTKPNKQIAHWHQLKPFNQSFD